MSWTRPRSVTSRYPIDLRRRALATRVSESHPPPRASYESALHRETVKAPVTWMDRLRIERVVWALDQQLYDLPRASRIAKRREVRENLFVAAHDIGTAEALRRLGGSRQLASEYLSAEYGSGPRHSWVAAAYFFVSVPLVLTALLAEAANAYGDGIIAANPNATGAYTWHGISYLQHSVTYTFTNGTGSSVGGDWVTQPLPWILLIGGTILVGRLWRLPASRHDRRTTASTTD